MTVGLAKEDGSSAAHRARQNFYRWTNKRIFYYIFCKNLYFVCIYMGVENEKSPIFLPSNLSQIDLNIARKF